MKSTVFFRAPFQLVNGFFKPVDDRNKWKVYDPFEVYDIWKGNPSKNFSPHIDFSKIKDGDTKGMLEFLTLWGSLYSTRGDNGIPVDAAMTLLSIYRDVVEWKVQLDLGTITLEDANRMASVIQKYTRSIRVSPSFVMVKGKVTYQDFQEAPNLFDCMMQMLNSDIRGGRFITRKCAKEDCGTLFTTASKRIYCLDKCGDAVRAMRSSDKKFTGRAERRKERLGRE